ncbi:unnamed protein product [Phytophthora fragariaefolia]|uniref:Unnamed protein product n=1 Tax=Phytophthora fragariaefolia TaxID=1490495 RepID=A0A9W7D5H5_9STRA|nr:unnamed protein product [Phytophthora fragariaefolia]
MLSDHPPISSIFSWTLNDDIRLSNTFGGPHGDQFTDVASAAGGQTVKSITLRSGSRVDAVSLTMSAPTTKAFTHGGTGGTAKTLTLSSGEYITAMEAHWGKYNSHTRIFNLKFMTSLGNTLSGGTTTGDSATVYAPEGYQLSAFHGRGGDEIDALGAIWTKIST